MLIALRGAGDRADQLRWLAAYQAYWTGALAQTGKDYPSFETVLGRPPPENSESAPQTPEETDANIDAWETVFEAMGFEVETIVEEA